MKDFFGVLGAIAVGIAIVAGLSIGGYHLYAYLAPKYEATRRDVMIESRQYQEGTIREIYTLQRQYGAAKNDAERDAIAAAVRHEVSIFPRERVPGDLQAFLTQVGAY